MHEWTHERFYVTQCTTTEFLSSLLVTLTSQEVLQLNPMTSINGAEIERMQTYKYLGLRLDQRLRFDSRADYLTKNIWPKICTLRRIRKYITTNTSLYIYSSIIEPCFTFNYYIYDPLTIHDQNRLQVLQNTCLCTCLGRGPLSHRKTCI